MGVCLTGNVRIIEFSSIGLKIAERQASNTLTSGGLALIAAYLGAGISSAGPQPPFMMVFGSGTVPVGRFMTSVPGETFRNSVVDRFVEGASVTFRGYLQDTDNANQIVGCYGLLAGVAGVQPGNAGVDPMRNEILFAVANEPTPYNKGAAATVSIEWLITISGVI